jgi:hypothetical protein
MTVCENECGSLHRNKAQKGAKVQHTLTHQRTLSCELAAVRSVSLWLRRERKHAVGGGAIDTLGVDGPHWHCQTSWDAVGIDTHRTQMCH